MESEKNYDLEQTANQQSEGKRYERVSRSTGNYNRENQENARPQRPRISRPRISSNDEGSFRPSGFGMSEQRQDTRQEGYRPRYNEGGYRPRQQSGYRPHYNQDGQEGGYQPRQQGSYRPRYNQDGQEGGYQPRQQGGYRPRYNQDDQEGGYQPRQQGGYRPRYNQDGQEGGYQPRQQSGYRPQEAISNVRSKAAIVHSRAASVRTISPDVHNRAVTSVSTTTTTIRMQSTV